MLEPGDIRDLVIELREDNELVAWQTIVDAANKKGHDTSSVEKAINAARNQGLIYEPRRGEFEPL